MKQEWPTISKLDQNDDPKDRERRERQPAKQPRRPADAPHPDIKNTNWDAAEKQGEPGQTNPPRAPR